MLSGAQFLILENPEQGGWALWLSDPVSTVVTRAARSGVLGDDEGAWKDRSAFLFSAWPQLGGQQVV